MMGDRIPVHEPDPEPFEPAYSTWTPCEDRTPEQIRAEEAKADADAH